MCHPRVWTSTKDKPLALDGFIGSSTHTLRAKDSAVDGAALDNSALEQWARCQCLRFMARSSGLLPRSIEQQDAARFYQDLGAIVRDIVVKVFTESSHHKLPRVCVVRYMFFTCSLLPVHLIC